MKIDYELIKTFPQLGLYQSKAAIADYAEENFKLKIPRNLSYENMVKRLEEHVKAESSTFKLVEPVEDVELNEAFDGVLVSKMSLEMEKEISKTLVEKITESEFIDNDKIEEMATMVKKSNDKKSELMSLLPPDFKPCFTPMGNHETFYPMSYWINDWIQSTPDWYYKIHEYERVQEHKFLYTLVYYIALYGKFTIRETRNGDHIALS